MCIRDSHRIVRVQAFEVGNAGTPRGNAGIGRQYRRHAAGGVFAEHQIGGIGQREGLLVFALDCRLYRRAQRGFQCVHQAHQRQFIERRLQLLSLIHI